MTWRSGLGLGGAGLRAHPEGSGAETRMVEAASITPKCRDAVARAGDRVANGPGALVPRYRLFWWSRPEGARSGWGSLATGWAGWGKSLAGMAGVLGRWRRAQGRRLTGWPTAAPWFTQGCSALDDECTASTHARAHAASKQQAGQPTSQPA